MTVENRRNCEKLILLVGSNPLPNFLAALVLKPKFIHFLYSCQTKNVKDKLEEKLKNKLPEFDSKDKQIEDATDAVKVRCACDFITKDTHKDTHLHYSGGTKVMAAHARIAFRDAGGKDGNASYLDEREGILRFDDNYEIHLSKERLDLTINDVLGLHGIEPKSKDEKLTSIPTDEDAKKIAMKVFKEPCLAAKLYELFRNNGELRCLEEAKKQPIPIDEFVNDLSIRQFPERDWDKKTYEGWAHFLGGGWLERWCGALVRDIADGDKVSIGLQCKLANGRQFEIDVALVRGHRFYVISCTTGLKISLCKSKLFEVAVRARQLGGDLARSALVCLLDGRDNKSSFIDQLRNDLADVWEAPNKPKVFGLSDLKEWAGIETRPKTIELKKWLDS